jgi:PAS domain S-box-containing protein
MRGGEPPHAPQNVAVDVACGACDEHLLAQRLLAAFEHLNESIVLTDPDDRFVLANRAFRDLNCNVAHAIQPGMKFEDYLRAGLAVGNYPDAIGREQEWLAARLEERRNPGRPVERQRNGGRWFLIDDRRLPDGSTIRFGTDITERKRAEIALNNRNRDLQLVVDSVPVMITRIDRDERFLFANRAYTDLMELPVDEVVGRKVSDLVSPEVYARIKPALNRALSGDPVSIERYQARADGGTVEIEGRYIPDVDVEGRVIGMFALHRDVTAERRARESLARSEARFRSLTALSTDWYWEQDAQFRYVYISEDADARGAMDMKQRAGKMRWELPSSGLTEEQWAAHRAQLEAHQVFRDFEFARPGPDGATIWLSVSGEPIFDANGRFTGYRGITRNITERKRVEAELTQRSRDLPVIMDSLPAMISRADGEQRYVFVNRAYELLMERGAAELLGRRISDIVGPEMYATVKPNIDRVLAGETVRFERTQVRSDGDTRHLDVLYVPDLGRDGRSRGWFALHWDVTERKRTEDALASTEARFRAVFERSSAGMAITDENGNYLSVNAAFARFFGYGADEIVGRMRVSDLREAGDAEGVELYRQLIAGEIGFFKRDRPYRRKNGTQVWGRATASAVHDHAGGKTYVVAVFSDITEEVLARARIERMNAELEERVETRTAELREAVKELDAFTYSVSHDLRAPIGAVSGFAHLLRSAEAERLSDDGKRLLGFIEHNAERMTRLIEGLLRFSRLGRSDLHRTRVSMNGLAAESLMDFVEEAARAQITAGSMPDCNGDPALLSQVWANLMGNALKYSRGARLPCIDIGWDDARQAYFVRDNGAGFDMAYAGKLFGVFERLHAETEFEGSGIGLAIAERIVRLHGGAIWADAAPGRGATFWFTVPGEAGRTGPEPRPRADCGQPPARPGRAAAAANAPSDAV